MTSKSPESSALSSRSSVGDFGLAGSAGTGKAVCPDPVSSTEVAPWLKASTTSGLFSGAFTASAMLPIYSTNADTIQSSPFLIHADYGCKANCSHSTASVPKRLLHHIKSIPKITKPKTWGLEKLVFHWFSFPTSYFKNVSWHDMQTKNSQQLQPTKTDQRTETEKDRTPSRKTEKNSSKPSRWDNRSTQGPHPPIRDKRTVRSDNCRKVQSPSVGANWIPGGHLRFQRLSNSKP